MKQPEGDEERRVVLANAMKYVGSIRGEDPARAKEAGDRVKEIIRAKNRK